LIPIVLGSSPAVSVKSHSPLPYASKSHQS